MITNQDVVTLLERDDIKPLDKKTWNYQSSEDVYFYRGEAVKLSSNSNPNLVKRNFENFEQAGISYPATAYFQPTNENYSLVVTQDIIEQNAMEAIVENPEKFIEDVHECIERAASENIEIDSKWSNWGYEKGKIVNVDINDKESSTKYVENAKEKMIKNLRTSFIFIDTSIDEVNKAIQHHRKIS